MTNFSKYGTHLLKKIKDLSEKVNDHPSQAGIHAFRVEVKKIKALIHFLSWCFPGFDKGSMKKLNKLFSIAGIIREWQIFSEEIHDSHLPVSIKEEILNQTHHEEKKASQNFRRNYKKSMPGSLEQLDNYLGDFFEKASKINSENYFRDIAGKITVNWKENTHSPAYHHLRKDIKELKYNLKILDDEQKTSFHFLNNTGFLNKMEELLGNWHDSVVASNQLQSLIDKEKLTPEAQVALIRLKKIREGQAGKWISKFKHDFNQLQRQEGS